MLNRYLALLLSLMTQPQTKTVSSRNKPQAAKRKYLVCLMLKYTIEKSNSGLGNKYVLEWRFGVREARSKLTFMQRLYEERRCTVSHFLGDCQSSPPSSPSCSVWVSEWVLLTIFEEQQGWSSSGGERQEKDLGEAGSGWVRRCHGSHRALRAWGRWCLLSEMGRPPEGVWSWLWLLCWE